MSQATILQLLPQTIYTNSTIVTGNKVPAAAYYLGNQDLQTLSWNVTNFLGTIYIQATLASEPNEVTDGDWFNVYAINNIGQTGLTETNFYNLHGNFVWLRAKVSFGNYAGSGVIQYVKVSY